MKNEIWQKSGQEIQLFNGLRKDRHLLYSWHVCNRTNCWIFPAMKKPPVVESIRYRDKSGKRIEVGGLWKNEDSGKYYLETLLGDWILLTDKKAREILHQYCN